MITHKRETVNNPEETKRNKSKKVVKFGAFDKRDRRSSKQSLRKEW